MDTRNVIAAISLSAAVIVLYSLFFLPDPQVSKQNLTENEKIEKNTDTPSLDPKEKILKKSLINHTYEKEAPPSNYKDYPINISLYREKLLHDKK